MRRILMAGSLLVALCITPSASAITYGEPDGQRHPNVGALLAPEPYSDGTWATCSGTLISPTVFLTAAHCDQGLTEVDVTFESVYEAPKGKTYRGTWHPDPAYTWSQDDTHDLAVVVFNQPVKGITPARLPTADSLSRLPKEQPFTSVGYGAQSITNGPGGKTLLYSDVRHVSSGTLNSINQSWLRISQNPATGDGGTCYGDSGGPNFLGSGSTETDILAATTITGDAFCRSTNVVYRLDTASARAFLGRFVTLP